MSHIRPSHIPRTRLATRIHPVMLFALSIIIMIGFTGCGQSSENEQGDAQNVGNDAQLTLAVIPKGTTHIFWQTVEAGARRAADEMGVRIHWKGPISESDRAGQIEVVQQFISQGVSGIVLAPLDATALRGPVEQANQRDIPVVVFDSALEGEPGENHVSFVATNNRSGGRLGGETLAELIDGAGEVAMMRYQVGSASTTAREEGFLEVMVEHENINVTVTNRYAGATTGEAKTTALNMIDRLRSADAIFTPNESTTYGMLLALRQENLAGEKHFVGFDASPPLVEALRNGEIDALIVQDPDNMGYTAVKTLVEHLRGETVSERIDTGVAVVTRENMDDPDIKPLLPKSE